jgi:hypothetical protein
MKYMKPRARRTKKPKKMQTETQTQTNAQLTRQYTPKQASSIFTLLVYFKREFATNGSENGRKFHSDRYEQVIKGGQVFRDDKFAFDKLRAFVLGELSGKYKTAIIYHNPTNKIILQLSYNSVRINNEVFFTVFNNGNSSKFAGFAPQKKEN